MARKSLAAVQRGVLLADAIPSAKARRAKRRGQRRRPRALRSLKGPFLSHGSLTRKERLRLLNGIRKVIEGAFTHLPLKRARYEPVGFRRMRHARPNDAHHSLASLERRGRIAQLVTQNVDGLHQAAGSQNVIDLHGRSATPGLVDAHCHLYGLGADLEQV